MNRRSFLRVAIIGATGVAAVELCPDWLAEALLPKKTYCFLNYASPPAATVSMEDINSITLQYINPYMERLRDVLYHPPSPLFQMMTARSRIKADGGVEIHERLVRRGV